MEKKIKSAYLIKYLSRITNKEILEEADLQKIYRLVINFNYLDVDEKVQIFDDFKLLTNLKDLSLIGFIINQEDIEKISSINSLKFVTFDFCTITCDLKGNFTHVVFNICKGLDLNKIIMNNLKELRIIKPSEEIDIKNILECKSLEILCLLNSKVNNILDVCSLNNLEKIDLSGTNINDDTMELLRKKMEVIHEEEYHPTGL